MSKARWMVPAIVPGLLLAVASAVHAAPPSSPPTTAPPAGATVVLSTTSPGRHQPFTATVAGCSPGEIVRIWHHALYVDHPGPAQEGDPELYEITTVTCRPDGSAAASFTAGQAQWEDPSRTLTGGVVEATFGPDSTVAVARASYQIAGGTPSGRLSTSGDLPATGRTRSLAAVAAGAVSAGLALVLAARRRRPA